MRETLKIANYLSLDEVKTRMQMRGALFRVQKWLVIYNALIDPRPVSEIARHTGLAEGTVRRIIAEYNSLGPEFFDKRVETPRPTKTSSEQRKSIFA